MKLANGKFEVEPLDESHVRLKIRDGEKTVTVILRVVAERAAELIEINRGRSGRTAEEMVAA
jgi:hypothetical protein